MGQLFWKLSIFLIATVVFDLSYAACPATGQDASVTTYFKSPRSGKATFYDVNAFGKGHCSIDPSPPIVSNVYATVAISSSTYGTSDVCGMCLNVTATGVGSGRTPLNGNYIVFVDNECTTCSGPTDLDFGKSGDGVWDIKWYAIPCPVGNTYRFQGSHEYYVKLQARNTRYPVKSISVKVGGSFEALERRPDNFFVKSATYTLPLEVQITSITGDVVTDTINTISNDIVIPGNVQFPDCGDIDPTNPTNPTIKPTTSPSNPTTKPTTSPSSPSAKPTSSASSSSPSSSASNSNTDGTPIVDSSFASSLSISFGFALLAALVIALF